MLNSSYFCTVNVAFFLCYRCKETHTADDAVIIILTIDRNVVNSKIDILHCRK